MNMSQLANAYALVVGIANYRDPNIAGLPERTDEIHAQDHGRSADDADDNGYERLGVPALCRSQAARLAAIPLSSQAAALASKGGRLIR